MGCEEEKIVVVKYGVDDRFIIEKCNSMKGKLRVLKVGEVGLRKGENYVGDVESMIKGEEKLRMVGKIEIKEEEKVKIDERVEMKGDIKRREMREKFKWEDVFLMN